MRGVCLLLMAMLFCLPAAAEEPPRKELLVFAAASLTDLLGELSPAWEKSSHVKVRLAFAASSILARQIEAGGTADVFVSADQDWMDYLAKRGLIKERTRRELAGNRLVLVAPADSTVTLRISPGFKLAEALAGGRLATGDPDTVPVGRYARAALTTLGVWDQVASRLVRAENARAAMTYVARGETPLGVVYATDAQIEKRIRVLDIFPDNTHPPITYPAAATANAAPMAVSYLAWLSSNEAAAIWKKHGFREARSSQ